MVILYIDSDELYPYYSLMSKKFSFTTSAEVSEEKHNEYVRIEKEFRNMQEELKVLSGCGD